ncbi:MAG: hypothetical protein M3R36_19050 [Bacteroidota bacterium]|nr:hypothetical protein [Bacteroidota bacterium]
MHIKKKPVKDLKASKKDNASKKKSSDDFEEEKQPKGEREIEEMLEDEMPGELDEEDDEEFIHNVEEFEKEHSKAKMISVYQKIGKPKFTDLKKIDPKKLKDELRKLVVTLDDHNIIVHSHGEYDDKEKYRFITEEIFKEYIEDGKKEHISFIYEDYHPEMDEDDEEEESFDEDMRV